MEKLLADLKAFHIACDVPVLPAPALPPQDRLQLRERLLTEEFEEYKSAIRQSDLVEAADALADLIYVAVGTALELGIPLDRVWNEVQRSNMAKVDPETGKVRRRDDGKILKPDGWAPPDVKSAIGM